MSDVIQLNEAAQVREQASLWLVRLQEGLSGEQKEQLQQWINADDAHGEQLLTLASLWDELGVLTELAPLFDDLPTPYHAVKENVVSTSYSPRFAITAGIVLSSLLGLAVFKSTFIIENWKGIENWTPIAKVEQESQVDSLAVSTEHYMTEVGEHSEIRLSDGSVATLNTDSHIVINFDEKVRNIKLLKGEVHFDVHKDASRPLSVIAAGKSVRAVGTAFSVRTRENNHLEVAVDEGTVAVYAESAGGLALDKSSLRSLQAGDVLVIDDNTQKVAQYDPTEMEERLAWKKGMIVINDETLDYVVSEFGRYSQRKILLADRDMGGIRVAGYFRLGDIDALLLALEKNFQIRSVYYKKDKTFVLSQL